MIRSPTCRIFAKDLRRFWPLLLSAAALDAFGVLMPLGTTNSTYYGGVTTSDAVMYVRWFVMAFVAVAMAQDDSPSGDRGSWLARPITPGAVLGAKVCMLGLGLALPAGLAAAGAAFMVHAGPGILLASVFGMGSTVFLVGAAFLFLGSLTASLLQASLATVVFFVLKSLTAQSLWAFEGLLRPTSTELGQLPALPSERTMAVVSLVSAVVALSAVLVHQFFTRRTRRTLQLLSLIHI